MKLDVQISLTKSGFMHIVEMLKYFMLFADTLHKHSYNHKSQTIIFLLSMTPFTSATLYDSYQQDLIML